MVQPQAGGTVHTANAGHPSVISRCSINCSSSNCGSSNIPRNQSNSSNGSSGTTNSNGSCNTTSTSRIGQPQHQLQQQPRSPNLQQQHQQQQQQQQQQQYSGSLTCLHLPAACAGRCWESEEQREKRDRAPEDGCLDLMVSSKVCCRTSSCCCRSRSKGHFGSPERGVSSACCWRRPRSSASLLPSSAAPDPAAPAKGESRDAAEGHSSGASPRAGSATAGPRCCVCCCCSFRSIIKSTSSPKGDSIVAPVLQTAATLHAPSGRQAWGLSCLQLLLL